MKIVQLKQIQTALTAWAKKQTTLSYQIAKNLNAVNSVIKKADDAFSTAKEPFLEKDDKGNNKTYYADAFSNLLNEIVQGEAPPPNATQMVNKITDPTAVADLLKQYNEDEHEIVFHTISEEKFQSEIEKGNTEAEIIVPLIGTIVQD